MDKTEARRRDGVMRTFFEGKDWDENDEFRLKRSFVLRSAELLPDYEFLIDDEWEVEAGRTDGGRGDLLFTDGEGRYAVVEVKYINERSGSTARVKRTKSRSKVREQAENYAHVIATQRPDCREVVAFAYTNEHGDAAERGVCLAGLASEMRGEE